jgi:hypothetical protein
MLIRRLGIIFAVASAACWLWPGAITELSFHALTVSVAMESVIIGALFFVGAAVLWLIRPSGDKRLE